MLCRRELYLYMKYSEKVVVYAVIVHQTNISYSNGVPVCKDMVEGEPRLFFPFYSLLPGFVISLFFKSSLESHRLWVAMYNKIFYRERD